MFHTGLKTEKISDQTFILLSDLIWNDGIKQIVVKKGFDFDGASIPQAFWSIIGSPFTGNYTRAATLHDALYASEIFDRKTCDDLFLEAMRVEGVGYAKRYAMYWAVRAGGSLVWKKHTKEETYAYKKFIVATCI